MHRRSGDATLGSSNQRGGAASHITCTASPIAGDTGNSRVNMPGRRTSDKMTCSALVKEGKDDGASASAVGVEGKRYPCSERCELDSVSIDSRQFEAN